MLKLSALSTAAAVIAMTASGLQAADQQAIAAPAAASARLTLTLTGDTGLNPTNQTVAPNGVTDGGVFQTWADTTAGIGASIDGDINFTNIETVVTDRNDLAPDLKGQGRPFNFRMHPNGLKHLVKTGFNVLSLANNHSMDYGPGGALETLKHVGALRGQGVLGAAGTGKNFGEASQPDIFEINGHTIAYAATGILTNDLPRHRAGANSPGQTSYRSVEDFTEVRRRLVEAPANLRILSVHYGYEGYVRADQKQFEDFRGLAADKDGIDVIVGHHAHVVRGVEMRGKSLIFYGLGNFLHHGTANITGNGLCRDYGLLARVHLSKSASGALAIEAVEAVPVTDTHRKARPMSGDAGTKRIHVLNYLAGLIDDNASGAAGLRFTPQPNGSGLYCVEGAETLGGKIGALCKSYKPAPSIPDSLRGAIASSCSR